MSDDRRTYSEREFAVILSRASELASGSPEAERHGAFSLEEMKAIAAEVGIDPALIERAARLVPAEADPSAVEKLLGGPIFLRRDAGFDTSMTEERSTRLLSAVRAIAEAQGEGDANAAGMSWNSVGEGSQLFLTAHSDGDGTRVRVTIDRRGGLVITGMLSLLGGLGASVAVLAASTVLDIGSGAAVAASIGGVMAGAVAIGRAFWTSTGRSLRVKADQLMDTATRLLQEGEHPGVDRDTDTDPERGSDPERGATRVGG